MIVRGILMLLAFGLGYLVHLAMTPVLIVEKIHEVPKVVTKEVIQTVEVPAPYEVQIPQECPKPKKIECPRPKEQYLKAVPSRPKSCNWETGEGCR